jgi:CheY-like chemotaxis protein
VISFLALTVSNITKNDTIRIRINAKNHKHRSDLHGDIEATCPAVCSRADFNSILQVFTAPAEEETLNYTDTLRAAEQQAMLDLSIAREMCKLLFGDLEVIEKRQLHLRFSMSFSTRAQYVLKRKGNICSDVEEFVKVEAPAYFNHKDEAFDDSEVHYASITRFRSESSVTYRPCKVHVDSRRAYTIPNHHTALKRLPSIKGDKDDSPPHDQIPSEPFALVADDVPMNATVLCQMLSRLGVRTAAVSNGAEAFNFMQTSEPDVIFMDCEMPVMDGLEATRRLRERGVKVPIVAVTANGPEKEAECLAAGMDYFVSKPVRFAGLAGLLEKLKLK